VRAQPMASAIAAVGLIRCVHTLNPSLKRTSCRDAPIAPTISRFPSGIFPGRENQPIRIIAGRATAMAVMLLKLPTVRPGNGPSPDLNPWNKSLTLDTEVTTARCQPSLAGQSPGPVPDSRAHGLRNDVRHQVAVQITSRSRHA
jgi:hypothetical protein